MYYCLISFYTSNLALNKLQFFVYNIAIEYLKFTRITTDLLLRDCVAVEVMCRHTEIIVGVPVKKSVQFLIFQLARKVVSHQGSADLCR